MNAEIQTTSFESTRLTALERDLKRMLRVQFREFIHTIEDLEFENGMLLFTDNKPRTKQLQRKPISSHVA